MGSLTTYKGNCHCGANRFECQVPEVTSATECNCSLCFKRDPYWVFPDGEDAIKVTRGNGETLTAYGSAAIETEFCSNCGSLLYGTHKSGPLKDKRGVNVRDFLGVNPFKLKVTKSDGRADESPTYTPPEFNGPVPEAAEEENDEATNKLYTGSCHCGAVRLAVKTKPLPQVEVKQDNCSICVRNVLVGLYPDGSQVSIVGRENTKDYSFERKFNGSPFCATCGCAVFSVLYGPPQAVIDRLPEAKKEFVRKQLRVQPVNIRMLEGVEWDKLNIQKSDEGTEGYTLED